MLTKIVKIKKVKEIKKKTNQYLIGKKTKMND